MRTWPTRSKTNSTALPRTPESSFNQSASPSRKEPWRTSSTRVLKTASQSAARRPHPSCSKTPEPENPCVLRISSRSGRSSLTSSAAVGAPTALPSWKPGVICMQKFAKRVPTSLPSRPRPPVRTTSPLSSTLYLFPCWPTPVDKRYHRPSGRYIFTESAVLAAGTTSRLFPQMNSCWYSFL